MNRNPPYRYWKFAILLLVLFALTSWQSIQVFAGTVPEIDRAIPQTESALFAIG